MKTIEQIKSGKNYTAVNVGRMNEIIEHELPMGPDMVIKGKVFVGQAVGATGSEFSFQTLVPGQDSGFLHTHKTHEELYFILKGEGQYQVDGEIFPVSEGSVVRVAPEASVRSRTPAPRTWSCCASSTRQAPLPRPTAR